MKKLIVFNMVSLDGFFEGPNHEIDWHNVDDEFNEFAIAQLNSVDTLLFGRVTYQLMANYWPTDEAKKDDPLVTFKMNSLPKIVFSKTLSKVDWKNSRLVNENVAEEITKLKRQPVSIFGENSKDIFIFGSSNLISSIAPLGLIDEIRLMVNPVLLGKGNPLFKGITNRINLKLLRTKTFNSGNVLIYYQPEKKG